MIAIATITRIAPATILVTVHFSFSTQLRVYLKVHTLA